MTYILSTSALTKAQLKRGSSGNFTVFSSYLFLPNTSLKIYWHKIAINLLHSWFLWVTDCNSAQWALLVSHSALSCLWLKLGRPEWQLQWPSGATWNASERRRLHSQIGVFTHMSNMLATILEGWAQVRLSAIASPCGLASMVASEYLHLVHASSVSHLTSRICMIFY